MTCPTCNGPLASLFTSTYCPACDERKAKYEEARDKFASATLSQTQIAQVQANLTARRLFIGDDGELWFGRDAADAMRITMPNGLGPCVGFQVQYSHTLGLGVYVYRRNEYGMRWVEILANTMLPMDVGPRKWPENGVVTVSVRP